MATIDPSIALGIKPIQLENPVNQFAKAQDVAVNALKMQEYQRGLAEENALRELVKGGLDLGSPEAIRKMYEISPKQGMAFEKQRFTLNKERAAADKQVADLEAQLVKNARDTLGVVNDQATYDVWRQQTIAKLPGLAQIVPAQFTPQAKLALMADANKYIDQNQVSEFQRQDLGLKRERLQKDTDPVLQANLANAREYGQTLGKNRATAEAALPNALQTAEEGIRLIDEMVGKAPVKDASGKVIQAGTKPHPGFKNYVGAALVPGMRFVEGSDTASYEVRQKQIEGKAFLEAFQALKGGGSITEKEGEKGTQAIMRMNKASKESEYIAAARELQDILRTGMDRSRAKAGQTSPVVSNAAPAAPRPGAPAGSENVIDFNSLKK
jgi:hypothetical protein